MLLSIVKWPILMHLLYKLKHIYNTFFKDFDSSENTIQQENPLKICIHIMKKCANYVFRPDVTSNVFFY